MYRTIVYAKSTVRGILFIILCESSTASDTRLYVFRVTGGGVNISQIYCALRLHRRHRFLNIKRYRTYII